MTETGVKEDELLAKIISLKWSSLYDRAQRERLKKLENLRTLADNLIAHIGAYGEVDSRHQKVHALLDALYDTYPELDVTTK